MSSFVRYCFVLFIPVGFVLLSACSIGPDYVRPATEVSKEFKENQQWKQAEPKDDQIGGKWWEAFNDPELNKLAEQVEISNQNVKASEAAYRQAKAFVSQAYSAYFPLVTAGASQSRGASGGNNTNAGGNSGVSNRYNASLDASWEIDLWGKIRRSVEEEKALADASFAELGAAKLSAQATLAINYMSLRIVDEQKRLLDNTVRNYEKVLEITKNLYSSGVNGRSDYLQAKTQLESAQAQGVNLGIARAQYEHAIAVLIGKAPADFSFTAANTIPPVPVIPVGVPSGLLERRPDIAAAERRVIAANAGIGVAKAAYFPDITLSASGGYQSSQLAEWFSLPNRVWSLGPSIVQTIFDAGLRRAQTKAAIASYDQTVAVYRQTVLGGLQEVEDNLVALRILEEEAVLRQSAVMDAQEAERIITNQYKSGIVSYLNVITAQNARLNTELAALDVIRQRLTAAVTLIKALGGGWK